MMELEMILEICGQWDRSEKSTEVGRIMEFEEHKKTEFSTAD